MYTYFLAKYTENSIRDLATRLIDEKLMALEDPVVITGIARTPIGGFLGELSSIEATELGSIAIAAALTRSGLNSDDVDEVIMGCVLPAGLGQAPARQASIAAGIKKSAGCTTVNKAVSYTHLTLPTNREV